MNLTFYGHSCFALANSSVNILFDPASSMLGTPDVNPEEFNPDFMCLSHGHGDHVADAISIAKRTECKVISNYEIVTWLGEQGIQNGMPLNHGGQYHFDFGTIKYVNAVHSSVLPDGTYGGNPGGFLINIDGKQIYYAGDTALTWDMKIIGEQCNLDWAILPIGDVFTMGIDDAIIASEYISCDNIIGMHFDTFPPIAINKDEAKTKFNSAGKKLTLLNINETLEL